MDDSDHDSTDQKPTGNTPAAAAGGANSDRQRPQGTVVIDMVSGDEQYAREMQQREFRSLPGVAIGQPVGGDAAQPGVYGRQADAPIVVLGNPVAFGGPGGAPGSMGMMMPQGPPNPKLVVLYQLGRSVQCFGILDLLLCALMALQVYWFIILVPLPLIGFFAARRYNARMLWAYIAYLALVIVLRTLLFVSYLYANDIPQAVLMALSVIIEGLVLRYVDRYRRLLLTATPEELLALQTGAIGPMPQRQGALW